MGKLAHEREIRRLVDGYERQLSERHFHELDALSHEHRLAHEREHEFTEAAIEKATFAISAELHNVTTDIDRLRADGSTYMTEARFEREHAQLSKERLDDHEQLRTLVTQIRTLTGIVIFLGLPGLAALGWMILAALAGQHTTGTGGLIP